MLSFNPADWTESTVQVLIEMHNFVFGSVSAERRGRDLILEYGGKAVAIVTNQERCDLFHARAANQASALELYEEGRPWEQTRIAVFFYDQAMIVSGRKVAGLYLIDPRGVEQYAARMWQQSGFTDAGWVERITAARLIGEIVEQFTVEAGRFPEFLKNSSGRIAVEHSYLISNKDDEGMFLPLIRLVVLR